MKYIKIFEDFEDFEDFDDPMNDDPINKYTEIIGYGKFISLFKTNWIEPTLRGLIRDKIDFDFYTEFDGNVTNHLIILKGDWKNKIKDNLMPSIDQDRWYVQPLTGSDWYSGNWTKIDDVEIWLDAKKYNL